MTIINNETVKQTSLLLVASVGVLLITSGASLIHSTYNSISMSESTADQAMISVQFIALFLPAVGIFSQAILNYTYHLENMRNFPPESLETAHNIVWVMNIVITLLLSVAFQMIVFALKFPKGINEAISVLGVSIFAVPIGMFVIWHGSKTHAEQQQKIFEY